MPYVATSFQNQQDCGTRYRERERQGFLLWLSLCPARNSVEEEFLFESNRAAVDQIVELDVLAPRLGLGKRASGHCCPVCCIGVFEIEARAIE